ncbi:hypothetical protein [Methylovulum psychrotolerans]|jgi:hypothetical protein|uniref:Uncharacterized protein n=1 Tax=Methylovulum psychrotolerans TaxID=1704499 RepID=A0A1Z4C1M0_9GAMM|nr:hypothetical protein [Methylovulum psychrotolerans]ASF47410.1 hypothetical protein CEK71_15820 [Methylovulum psychrotolerans]MBT9100297.1 hypothetical protein [Methylovulum psychrotolerans]POZ51271.1 hypothetical protein AADEFJLK_02717 [Methylovulum psychrotolerans]
MNMACQQQQKKPRAINGPGAEPKFPAARYFQVHFEHLQAQLEDTRQSLAGLHEQLAELNGKLQFHTEPSRSDLKK